MEYKISVDIAMIFIVLITSLVMSYVFKKQSKQYRKNKLLIISICYVAIFSYFSTFLAAITGVVIAYGIICLFLFYIKPIFNFELYSKE